MSKCKKHNYEIISCWDTGYMEKCTECDKTRYYNSRMADEDIHKFFAILLATAAIIGIVWALIKPFFYG